MLTNNTLAFIALTNEYCQAIESTADISSRREFVERMLKLLPRIYIAATDLQEPEALTPEEEEDAYIAPSLDEEYYDSVRRSMEALMGEHDTYLEVFEEDMRYSETPVAASISECLADLFQVFYNFTEQVKLQPTELIGGSIRAIAEEFATYWSRILCNVMRALNAVRYNTDDADDSLDTYGEQYPE